MLQPQSWGNEEVVDAVDMCEEPGCKYEAEVSVMEAGGTTQELCKDCAKTYIGECVVDYGADVVHSAGGIRITRKS